MSNLDDETPDKIKAASQLLYEDQVTRFFGDPLVESEAATLARYEDSLDKFFKDTKIQSYIKMQYDITSDPTQFMNLFVCTFNLI